MRQALISLWTQLPKAARICMEATRFSAASCPEGWHLKISHIVISVSYLKHTFPQWANGACCSGGHYWDCNPFALILSQVTTNLWRLGGHEFNLHVLPMNCSDLTWMTGYYHGSFLSNDCQAISFIEELKQKKHVIFFIAIMMLKNCCLTCLIIMMPMVLLLLMIIITIINNNNKTELVMP